MDMKKILFSLLVFQFAIFSSPFASAQKITPDAEYNLIRRSYTVNADGSMDIRFRKEIKLIRNRAFTAYADKGETFIEYNPAFETLTINECYTLQANGTKVVTPKNAFVEQLPSSCNDCGRYNGIREMAIVHTGLEYNCIIVLDYTLHRNSNVLTERFNWTMDCPVKRYEIIHPDGHTQIKTDIPQSVNDPYMPSVKGFDVEFQIGNIPQYATEKSLPEAKQLIGHLCKGNAVENIQALRDWVVDYVVLNPIDLARVDYRMTPASEVFKNNCGTELDKLGLLAALLNEAGFNAHILNNSISVFGDKPLELEVATHDGKHFILSASDKRSLTQDPSTKEKDEPVYIDRRMQWGTDPQTGLVIDTLVDGYCRVTLPKEKSVFNLNPALLTPSRKSDVQGTAAPQFIHYTIELPKNAKLLGGDVEIDYTIAEVGSIQIIVKQKGNRLLITRSLRLRKATIGQNDYNNFRRIMMDWNSYRELLIKL